MAFLFQHQDEKIIVFLSTCETVNYFYQLILTLNWSKFWTNETEKVFNLFKDKLYKLHGSIDHSERKLTFEQFDKSSSALLLASDVASRGLDFKGVNWVI